MFAANQSTKPAPIRNSFDPAPCIWCGVADFQPSREHILPESVGCPPGFVLLRDVCVKCNNNMGNLDRALLRQFELMAFIGNVPRKGGRRPSLDSWASIAGRYAKGGPEMHINGGPGLIEALGKTLKPVPATREIENVSFEVSGAAATLKFSQRFGDDPKFIRALYKVAVGVTAFWLGPHVVRGAEMNAVRKFVKKGKGAFRILMLGSSGGMCHQFSPPYKGTSTPFLAVGMRIFGVEFLADFDPDQRLIVAMENKLLEEGFKNWAIIPVSK